MNILVVFFTFSLLIPLSYTAIEFDYCVGDPKLPTSPIGYSCKDPAQVITDDFVYTGFRGEITTANIFKANVTFAFANTFPALNGLGIAMTKAEIGVGGVIPAHTHRTTEIIVVLKGSIIAGFVDTNNTAYYKRLEVGDVMVFPPTMIHFQVNVGKTPASLYASYNGANPGVQLISPALFASKIPTELVARITFISPLEITRISKILFGTA
ncbi:hypothetical protein SOVF_210270 [Spinacia oleracea]|uniref:Germin-like protein n=1 Tax=Spinacia oleracea TaxID=3562 RepID=A0A9R0JAC6_SPIOL|nr:auxin-binding protein ABP19a-like [Spinacia oleracea]KNA03324.1 hypothetical protein SOVF_210270 [Spinacia oleracea]